MGDRVELSLEDKIEVNVGTLRAARHCILHGNLESAWKLVLAAILDLQDVKADLMVEAATREFEKKQNERRKLETK